MARRASSRRAGETSSTAQSSTSRCFFARCRAAGECPGLAMKPSPTTAPRRRWLDDCETATAERLSDMELPLKKKGPSLPTAALLKLFEHFAEQSKCFLGGSPVDG